MNEQPQLGAENCDKKRKNPFSDSSQPKRRKMDSDSEARIKMNSLNDEKMEENMGDILPYEILIQIFQTLSPADRAKASVTCHAWRTTAQDDSLAWYPLSRYRLTESLSNYRYNKLKAPGSYKTLIEARTANITSDLQFDGILQYIGVDPYNRSNHYYWVKFNSEIRLFSGTSKFMSDDWNSDAYRYFLHEEKHHYAPGVFEMIIKGEVNVRKVERRVRNGETIGQRGSLLNIAAKHFLDQEMKRQPKNNWEKTYLRQGYNSLLSYTPQVDAVVTAQNERLLGVKLHDYQLRAINFMVSVEQERKQLKFSPLLFLPMSYLLVNPLTADNSLVLPEDAEKHDMTFTVKGGVLADEMGLGKSLEVLGLILQRPMIQKPDEDKLFVSKATLIFCPNHLVQQWQDEIEKHTQPKLSVLTITTIHHVKKYTPQDVMDADVVIASYNLLQNRNYLKYPNGEDDEKPELHPNRRFQRIDALLEENRKKKNAETAKGVILEHYLWHRIVLDEGHEVIKEDKLVKMLHNFSCTHKWLVSGTPFPRGSDMYKVRHWLDIAILQGGEQEYPLGVNYSSVYYMPNNLVPVDRALGDFFIQKLLWRNTKKSVNVEYEMVSVKEEIKSVTFTPLEKAIHSHFSYYYCDKEQRASCCVMQSEWGKTNEERKNYFIALRQKWINEVQGELDELNTKHQFYSTKLEKRKKVDPTNTVGLNAANDFMRSYPGFNTALTERLARHKAILKEFQSLELDEDNEEGHTTKLRELVSYLKELFERDPTKRVIIFSQYHGFLEQIGRELTENDIMTTNLKGNVYQKANGLSKFKADKSAVKVMLMSFNKTSSGTNLIEASHVIFMDPLNKSVMEVKAIESQAIGRAQRQGQTQPVTLVRFLVADSVETEVHARNTRVK